jgi:hypothetical protein
MWMNEHDVDECLRHFHPSEVPNLAKGAQVLATLVEWTNSNSDGWPYWTKPSRAAKNLMEALGMARQAYYRGTMVGDLTDAQLRTVLAPIKAFLTRQKIDHAADLPWAAILS